MTRKFTFALALVTAATLGSVATADQSVRGESPFRTAEYSQSDTQIVQVRNGRRYGGNYYRNRGYYNYYTPYGYRNYSYGYRTYPYRSYYYGAPNNRYYNYGGRGGVRVGPVGVWW
jgi:hypothetical protein